MAGQAMENPTAMMQQTQAQAMLKSNILAQTLVLAQQPHISVHLPLQSVKAEIYEGIPRKLSFSLSQKGLNRQSSKQWERGAGDYFPSGGGLGRDHEDEMDR